MKSIVFLVGIFAVSLAEDINLNELCSETLFGTLPHPTDRNQFIGCVQGKGTVLGCRNANDVFDPVRVSCVDKDSMPSLPVPPVDEICAGIDFGLLPVEDDCELHVLCDSERATVRRCPSNSVFNPNLQSCVPGDLESCADFDKTTESPTEEPTEPTTEATDPTTESTEPPTETTSEWTTWSEEPTTSAPDTTLSTNQPGSTPGDVNIRFQCDAQGGGNIPNLDNCSRYFECFLGIRNPQECPAGEIFDVITRQCGPPETSLCGRYITCG